MQTYLTVQKKVFFSVKVRVFGFWFQIAWILSVNHKGVCSSCYPLANIYCLYVVGFHYGLLHFSWKSFSDERVLHRIHKNSATKHFPAVSVGYCSIKMWMMIYHGKKPYTLWLLTCFVSIDFLIKHRYRWFCLCTKFICK